MNDPIITPTGHDGCSPPARTLNQRLQQLIGARWTPLPNQAGLAVLDRRGRRVATLFWEPVALPQEIGADGEQHHGRERQDQNGQCKGQPAVRLPAVHVVAGVVQSAGQVLPRETPRAQESGATTFSSHSTSVAVGA